MKSYLVEVIGAIMLMSVGISTIYRHSSDLQQIAFTSWFAVLALTSVIRAVLGGFPILAIISGTRNGKKITLGTANQYWFTQLAGRSHPCPHLQD